ncbi:MAG: hypothetical protein AAF447_26415 [Myxococcota bacterium]
MLLALHNAAGPLQDLPALETVDLRGARPPPLAPLVGSRLRSLRVDARYRRDVPEALRHALD